MSHSHPSKLFVLRNLNFPSAQVYLKDTRTACSFKIESFLFSRRVNIPNSYRLTVASATSATRKCTPSTLDQRNPFRTMSVTLFGYTIVP